MTDPTSGPSAETGAPGVPGDRLFFALFPDAAAAARIGEAAEDLRLKLGLEGQVHAQDRLHITLFHLGDFAGLPPQLVQSARAAAGAATSAPFEVALDHATSFSGAPGRRPCILKGGDGLTDLLEYRRALALALAGHGVQTTAAYTPHLTLLYGHPIPGAEPIPPISWTVRELVLVRSAIGEDLYERLGAWPLTRT